jgi:hypothetical protein
VSQKNGFRVPAKKEQLRIMETEVKNVQTSVQISQMMTQQLMQNMQNMSNDLGNALNQLYEMQYKFTAIKEALNLDSATLDIIANKHRLVDFEASAAKANIKDNLVEGTAVESDSWVIVTSTAADATGKDRGIFRSRFKLSECGAPALITGLAGKCVGDKVIVKLNELDHEVTLLSILNIKQEPTTEAVTPEVVVP